MEPSTVIRPSRLNQAVSQPVKRLPSIEPQWYRPPAVGKAEAICAMASPKVPDMNTPSGQPSPSAAPPAPEVACAKELTAPARMQMIEKEMAKLEKPVRRRDNSCAYPISCSTLRSSSRTAAGLCCALMAQL